MVSSSLRTAVLLLAALVVLPACDSTGEFVVGGTYTGQIAGPGFEATLTLVIPETETGESFDVTVVREGFDEAGSGRGTYDHPSIVITISDPGPTPDDVVEGTVSEGGDVITLDAGEGPFVLRRQ